MPVIELEAIMTTLEPPAAASCGLQPAYEVDRAEEVDRDTILAESTPVAPTMPAHGTSSVHDVGQLLDAGDGLGATSGRREVGDHVGIALVDGDDAVTLRAKQCCGGSADPAGGAADDVRS